MHRQWAAFVALFNKFLETVQFKQSAIHPWYRPEVILVVSIITGSAFQFNFIHRPYFVLGPRSPQHPVLTLQLFLCTFGLRCMTKLQQKKLF